MSDTLLRGLGLLERGRGRGDLSQKVSGTKKKTKNKPNPIVIAIILNEGLLVYHQESASE